MHWRPSHLREFLILRLRPLHSGPIHETRDVVRELLALRNRLEHYSKPQVRSDDEVGGGKLVAHQERPGRNGFCDNVHHGIEIAVPKGLAPDLAGARKCAVHHGALEYAGPEEQPFEIGAAPRIIDRDVEAGVWKRVGQIGADGGALGADDIAVPEPRHLSPRLYPPLPPSPLSALPLPHHNIV